MTPGLHTLPKEEKICGKTAVASLVKSGRWTATGHLRCCWTARSEEGPSRIVASVPKKLFKRAVRRNLLKRRIREGYRLQKETLPFACDMMFYYASPEILSSEAVYAEIGEILARIGETLAKKGETPSKTGETPSKVLSK